MMMLVMMAQNMQLIFGLYAEKETFREYHVLLATWYTEQSAGQALHLSDPQAHIRATYRR